MSNQYLAYLACRCKHLRINEWTRAHATLEMPSGRVAVSAATAKLADSGLDERAPTLQASGHWPVIILLAGDSLRP